MSPRNAILLLRISDDREGDEKGVGRQEKDGYKLAERLDWRIGLVLAENDTSAFKRKRIPRPNGRSELRTVRPKFREALDRLATGQNDGLLAYDLDRAARDPRDLEDLIDVVEGSDPRIAVESVTGSLRLANDSDITNARVLVAMGNKSSRDTARRVARKREELAEEGKPGGGGVTPFGFQADRITHEPAEADLIRWWADRILDPNDPWSTHRLATATNDRGVPTRKGRPWHQSSIVGILTAPRTAGLSVYRGEVVGKAAWEPILDQETCEQLRAELVGRGRGGPDQVALKRWLTGVLRCGRCKNGMLSGGVANGKTRYMCQKRHGGCDRLAIDAVRAEDEITAQVLEYFGSPDAISRLARVAGSVDTAGLRTQIAEDEQLLEDMAADVAHRRITYREYRRFRSEIADRVKSARALLTSSTPRGLRKLLEADDVAAAWKELGPLSKRELVLGLVGGYWVMPYQPGRPKVWDPDRLQPIPITASTTAAQDSDGE